MAIKFIEPSNEYLQLNSSLGLNVPFSISVWFRPTPIPSVIRGILAVQQTNNNNNFWLGIQSDGKIRALHGTDGFARTTTVATSNNWHHAALSFDSNSSRSIWLNGGGKHTDTTAGTAKTVDKILVGASWPTWGIQPFGGEVCYLTFWTGSLTDAEVTSLAAGIHPLRVKPQNWVEHFDLTRSYVGLKGNVFVVGSGNPGVADNVTKVYGFGNIQMMPNRNVPVVAANAAAQTNILSVPTLIAASYLDPHPVSQVQAVSIPNIVKDNTETTTADCFHSQTITIPAVLFANRPVSFDSRVETFERAQITLSGRVKVLPNTRAARPQPYLPAVVPLTDQRVVLGIQNLLQNNTLGIVGVLNVNDTGVAFTEALTNANILGISNTILDFVSSNALTNPHTAEHLADVIITVAAATSPNVANVNGVISADSGSQVGNPSTRLIDGIRNDPNNRWSVNGLLTAPKFAEINLRVDSTIREIAIYPLNDRPYQYLIETRTDAGQYSILVNQTANERNGPFFHVILPTVTAQYVKLTVTGTFGEENTTDWVSIQEVEVYGTALGSPPAQGSFSEHPGGVNTIQHYTTFAAQVQSSTQPFLGRWNTLVSYANNRLNEQPSAKPTYTVAKPADNLAQHNADKAVFEGDMFAAYSCAVVWYVNSINSGAPIPNNQYANKTVEMLMDWATVNTSIPVEEQTSLTISVMIMGFVNAAEMIWNYPQWTSGQKTQFLNWLTNIVLPGANFKKLRNYNDLGGGNYSRKNTTAPYDNNHNCWGILAAMGIERITNDSANFDNDISLWKWIVNMLIEEDGSMPSELSRGEQSILYTAYALEPLTACAEMIRNSGGENVFNYVAPLGGSLRKALDYLYDRGFENPNLWPVASARTFSGNYNHSPELFGGACRIYDVQTWKTWSDQNPPVIPDLTTGVGFPLPTCLWPLHY